MFAALPAPTDTNDTEGLTAPVLATLEGMFADKAHTDTIVVCLSMAESAMRAAVGESPPLL